LNFKAQIAFALIKRLDLLFILLEKGFEPLVLKKKKIQGFSQLQKVGKIWRRLNVEESKSGSPNTRAEQWLPYHSVWSA